MFSEFGVDVITLQILSIQFLTELPSKYPDICQYALKYPN